MSVIVPVIIYMLISFLFFKWLLNSKEMQEYAELKFLELSKNKDISVGQAITFIAATFMMFYCLASTAFMLISLVFAIT